MVDSKSGFRRVRKLFAESITKSKAYEEIQ